MNSQGYQYQPVLCTGPVVEQAVAPPRWPSPAAAPGQGIYIPKGPLPALNHCPCQPSLKQLGLGTLALAGSRDDKLRLIRRAYSLGVRYFETAEAEGPFHQEVLLGEALAKVGQRAHIATKFGYRIRQDGSLAGPDSGPDHIQGVVEASLTRLGINRLDLLYQEQQDPKVPMEKVAGAVADLVQAGKVAAFGLCAPSLDQLRRTQAVLKVSAVQWQLGHSADLVLDPRLLALCQTLGIALVFKGRAAVLAAFLAKAAPTLAGAKVLPVLDAGYQQELSLFPGGMDNSGAEAEPGAIEESTASL